jgi:type II secretory pathway pseudopilin PulG
MKKMNAEQGMTLIGFIMVIALIAFFALIVLRLFPLYNESFAATQSLTSVANAPEAAKLSDQDIRKTFLRNAQINGLSRFSEKNIKEYLTINKPETADGNKTVTLQYEGRNKLFGNLEIVLVYDKTMELRSN